MEKKKIILVCLFSLIFIWVAVIGGMKWQNHQIKTQIKKQLLENYVLEHASVEQSLDLAIDEYEKSQNAKELATHLIFTYGYATVAMERASVYQLNGVPYTADVDYLYEIQDQFDYYLAIAIKETIDISRDGEITETQFQRLLSYHQLLQKLTDLTITVDLGEKKAADFESDFETFYLNNKEEISALIN